MSGGGREGSISVSHELSLKRNQERRTVAVKHEEAIRDEEGCNSEKHAGRDFRAPPSVQGDALD